MTQDEYFSLFYITYYIHFFIIYKVVLVHELTHWSVVARNIQQFKKYKYRLFNIQITARDMTTLCILLTLH